MKVLDHQLIWLDNHSPQFQYTKNLLVSQDLPIFSNQLLEHLYHGIV